ncbi:hypothetical protein Q763_10760 [Flavobacterium beibuense F44-8]|uniref:DoxX family protein n=1 Tax=Flavobacterium beibuense F44-8 TaxID=1406840 RepID=A0A0A2LMQ9_9FLAO|nr:DoxX family protein [Flavobacterium beibuense]KGO80488.1 hypothetical protein Q763_10760 [Flavobacterium beibuense F44-8]
MNNSNTLSQAPWNGFTKFLFRFFFAYCTFSILPIIGNTLFNITNELISPLLDIEIVRHLSGSGDTLYDYSKLAFILILALIVALIWTLIDRKSKEYKLTLYWQETYIRYYLGAFMLVYGFSKVIKTQFGYPSLSALLSPLGNKSPMGLAWTFMGYSDTYTIFSGLCEVAGGLLLMYRKTRTLGAVVCFGVMLNVFLMNMSYDIPVKLFSFELLLLSAFLIGLDYKRLVNVFILNKPVSAQLNRNPFKPKWANLTTQILKGIAIIAAVSLMIYRGVESQVQYGDIAPKPPMYGIYEVENFIINNDTLPPMLTDTIRWRYVVLDKWDSGNIFKMHTKGYNSRIYFRSKADTINKHISFLSYKDSIEIGKFKYYKTDSIHYAFEGIYKNDTIKLNTLRTDENDYLLMNRGFHWINEYPYNR